MSESHTGGNIQPQLDYEEHAGNINAHRTILVSTITSITSLASIGTTPTLISDTNANRISLLLRNISPTTIFLGFTSGMSINTIYVRQNDVFNYTSRNALYALVAAGAGEVRYTEESI